MTGHLKRLGMTLVKLPFLLILWVLWAVGGIFIVWLWSDHLPQRSASAEALGSTVSAWPAGFVGIWRAFFGPGSREALESAGPRVAR